MSPTPRSGPRTSAANATTAATGCPTGLGKHERLPEPLLTPTTKAEKGDHDELTSRAAILASGAVSEDVYDRAAAMAARLFEAGTRWAAKRGLILVDTKYEIGLDADGELLVCDEVHTPDSSRYWYADAYEQALSEGRDPKALDKEYVRRWLVDQGYRGDGTPPELPMEVRCEAAQRYMRAFELLTGEDFVPETSPPEERIRKSLSL